MPSPCLRAGPHGWAGVHAGPAGASPCCLPVRGCLRGRTPGSGSHAPTPDGRTPDVVQREVDHHRHRVVVGVDTHKYVHVAVALDEFGIVIDTQRFAADRAGYAQLIDRASGLGRTLTFEVEGTGFYGAGLTSASQPTRRRPARAPRSNPAPGDLARGLHPGTRRQPPVSLPRSRPDAPVRTLRAPCG